MPDDQKTILPPGKTYQRRRFLAAAGACGAGATVLASGARINVADARIAPSESFDEQFKQLALNFEYLGAELYLHALTGTGLTSKQTNGLGRKGLVVAGGPVRFTSTAIQQVVEKLAIDEVAHVELVRGNLGTQKVAEPAINLTTSFNTLAHAAGFVGPHETFDPFADEISLLIAAYCIEDVCVTALAGVVASLNDPGDVTVAAGLLGVESAQAAVIRFILASQGRGETTNLISALRAQLSGAEDDIGTTIQGNDFNFVSNDAQGMVFGRTASQVLNVAYGGGATSNFLFFPNRVNGVIQQ